MTVRDTDLTPLTSGADVRLGYCFKQLVGGQCSSRTDSLMPVTKMDCCCTMGAAWGPQCEACPTPSSLEYQELCLDTGITKDGQGNAGQG